MKRFFVVLLEILEVHQQTNACGLFIVLLCIIYSMYFYVILFYVLYLLYFMLPSGLCVLEGEEHSDTMI